MKRRLFLPFLASVLASLLIAATNDPAEKTINGQLYVSFRMPIGISSYATKDERRIASEVVVISGQNGYITSTNNPVCCFWITIGRELPDTPKPGFILHLNYGTGFLIASDVASADAAVKRLRQLAVVDNGVVWIPVNIVVSSFQMVK